MIILFICPLSLLCISFCRFYFFQWEINIFAYITFVYTNTLHIFIINSCFIINIGLYFNTLKSNTYSISGIKLLALLVVHRNI